ncbi:MAG TPA: DNA polymerase IV [Spirochaetota bacterium]|jgi:nucleotidyltransferase/DNA polymerase involved in DNA repair|nr:DNA polymerase IV [Spirochaetota bacterium]HOH37344.1 DNA polymerase IV [Spirochaetota bacterium]HPJ13668.1 DNA polymerase IV [Spirochaetota bacterium]HPM33452.1 DNA polymerase IV [Spirochaetota bacterium]HPY02071.1 DNA polymerase IV [Spirochaetota bacterium]
MSLDILHADIDSFFASVEQIEHPSYRNQPVIVGADPMNGNGRGVVSTASYEARKFGIRSAMPISKAFSICPNGIFVKPDMSLYSHYSERVMNIFKKYSPSVEQISIDEAFIDVSGVSKLFGDAVSIAQKIRDDVKKETSLTVSVGIASNKACAKIASDINKPDGLTVCPLGMERDFISDLDITRLWGVGKKYADKLRNIGINTIGEIANRRCEEIVSMFGSNGFRIWMLSNGIDGDSVSESDEIKSISKEYTFQEDTDSAELLTSTIRSMADYVTRDARRHLLRYKTVSIKLRFSDFTTITRSETLSEYSDDYITAKKSAEKLLRANASFRKIRLIGLSISNFSDDVQNTLFEDTEKRFKTDLLIDKLKLKYGEKIGRCGV